MRRAAGGRSRASRVASWAAFLALVLAASPARAAEPQASSLLQKLSAAWDAHDADGYLALWTWGRDEDRQAEHDWLSLQWAGEESRLELQPPPTVSGPEAEIPAVVFSAQEPRGRVEQLRYVLRHGIAGWTIASRVPLAVVDGLIHLSLGEASFRADGLVARFPDFELGVRRGTLFMSPPTLGPTVLVLVGDLTVRFTPKPDTEKEQLRQFAGQPQLVEKVKVALVRIHPADLYRAFGPTQFDPAPADARTRELAQRFYREHVEDAYLLDAPLPRSPWWLLPALGDGLVTFESARGTLTYTVNQSEPEGVALFDRGKRRQIALYALPGHEGAYDEDELRDFDVLHHQLNVRLQPDRFLISGEDVLRIRLLSPTSTLRLRLAEPLRVTTVSSAEAGDHLFFRVRHQDTVMVSLGAMAGRTGEFSLTVRFTGSLRPEATDHEAMQGADVPGEADISLEETLVYANRPIWYPQGGEDDYATSVTRVEVPAGQMAVMGGRQTALVNESGRTVVEYTQDRPGKYLTMAVGRLLPGVGRQESGVRLEAWAVPRLRGQTAPRLAEAAAILRFYTAEFGPCPYPVLNLALLESRVPGGHSPPGMVVLTTRPLLMKGVLRDDPASFPEVPDFFLAHELAHQWWGHGVGGENYHERWISEAFAQYAAALWVRESRGEDDFRAMLARLGRWALRYSDWGPIHLGYRLGHLKGDPQIFRAIVYDKGAYVLHMLRQIMGDEPFRRALTRVQTDHRFTKIGAEDLRKDLEAASGMDLRPYFAAWIYGTQLPVLELSHRSERAASGYRTVVHVKARELPGPVPLEVSVTDDRGTEVRRMSVALDGGTVTVDTPSAPRRVALNRNRGLLVRIEGPRE